MKNQRSLFALFATDNIEEFNIVYEPACRALANWFIANPNKYLFSNSGHALRLASINTNGMWILGKSMANNSYLDEWIRSCYFGLAFILPVSCKL